MAAFPRHPPGQHERVGEFDLGGGGRTAAVGSVPGRVDAGLGSNADADGWAWCLAPG